MAIVNHIAAPSFETTGWQTAGGQTWSSTGATDTFARTSLSSATSGGYVLRHSYSNTGGFSATGGVQLDFSIPDTASNKTWTLSFNKIDTGTASASYTARIVPRPSGSNLASSLVSTGRNSLTFTQTPGLTDLRLTITASSTSSFSAYFDALRLCEGSDTTYIDGDTAGYTWTGTLGESTTVPIYAGIYNHWPQPRTTSRSWTAYWESSSQTSGGMTVTNGAGGVTVSGTISRSSGTTYLDVGASSGTGAALLHLGGIATGTAYLSGSVSGVTGLGANDQIKLIAEFFTAGKTSIATRSVILPRTGGRDGGAITVPAKAAYARIGFTIQTPAGFTSSSHAVSATIDFIRLAPQASTTYLDGNTAGYAWRGTAGDSVTIDTTAIEAAGTMGSSGSAEGYIQPYLEGHGALSFGGTLEVFLDSINASGAMSITGTADVWPYGPVIAEGTLVLTGDIIIAALVPIEGSGAMSITGTAEVGLAIPTFAIKTPLAITGSLEMGLPPDMVAGGSFVITGSVDTAIAGQTSGDLTLTIVGSLETTPRIPYGSFGDLAVFGTSETDPLRSITSGSNGGILSGANDAEWTRVYAEFAAPQETKQWRRAAYAAVGIQFAGVPANEWQEFTYVQTEVAASGGPTEYKPAASLRPLVYPDRLNVHPHGVGVLASPGPSWGGTPITSPIPDDVTGGLHVLVKAGQTMFIATNLDWLRPGATYTASMWIKVGGGDLTDVALNVTRATDLVSISDKMWWSDAEDDPDLGTGWRRIHCIFTAPDDGFARLLFDIQFANSADDYFDVAGMLVEEGIEVKDYFWPLENSADIGYRDGYSDATGGIFYYKDRGRRTYILKQALKDQVPIGIGILDPEFFLIPHVDV